MFPAKDYAPSSALRCKAHAARETPREKMTAIP